MRCCCRSFWKRRISKTNCENEEKIEEKNWRNGLENGNCLKKKNNLINTCIELIFRHIFIQNHSIKTVLTFWIVQIISGIQHVKFIGAVFLLVSLVASTRNWKKVKSTVWSYLSTIYANFNYWFLLPNISNFQKQLFTTTKNNFFWLTAAQDSSVPLKHPIITIITTTRDSENFYPWTRFETFGFFL